MARVRLILICFLLLTGTATTASDACRNWGIAASADVTVSDGTRFRTQTVFHGVSSAAISQTVDESTSTIAVDGGYSWVRQGQIVQAGEAFHKLFALGHQFHAFVLYFDELLVNVRQGSIEVDGQRLSTRVGDYPYGGKVHWVAASGPAHFHGFRFDFPDRDPILVRLDDWRLSDGRELPHRLYIDDGERIFDYRYTSITMDAGDASWYHQRVPAPSLDTVEVHRLHREMLVAHCAGDADKLAALSAPSALSVNRGTITQTSQAELAERFAGLFGQLDYQRYSDLILPKIDIAASGELGWAAVQVRASGEAKETGQRFDDQWAWVMLTRKIDGEWKHVGNASNRKPR